MKRVDTLLAGSANSPLQERLRHAMHDDRQLRDSISRIVPASSMAQLAFCRLEHGVLHLTVENAVWLTRLRFVERALLTQLGQEGWEVQSLKGHVLPSRAPVRARQAPRPAPVESAQGASGIRNLADSLEDGRLRRALERMAGHVGGTSTSRETGDADG